MRQPRKEDGGLGGRAREKGGSLSVVPVLPLPPHTAGCSQTPT